MADPLVCPECGDPAVAQHWGVAQTLGGFISPPDHNHDDNCLTRALRCEQTHFWRVALQRRCLNTTCDWVGKRTCFCHVGEKLDRWPDLPTEDFRRRE